MRPEVCFGRDPLNEQHTKRILALIVVVLVPALAMTWYRAHQASAFATTELIAYPLLFGGTGIVVIAAVKRWFLGESLAAYNAGSGSPWSDLGWGGLLCVAYFVLFFAERAALSGVLVSVPNLELLGLMLDMRGNPVLLGLWFGPVLWIGIASFEELLRVFMLSELWALSRSKTWAVAVIGIAAVMAGLLHWSQGPYGIVTITVQGLVSGTFFYFRRRLLPLVFAHVLYDGLQVGTLLLTYPR